MAIQVRFGTTTSDDRKLTKTIAWKQTLFNCDIYVPTDRLNPVIIVDTSKVNLDGTNYMEIPEFGRKYFITSIVGDVGETVNVSGHVDVLGTYDEQIRECPCIAARSSSHANMYLQDNSRLFNTYTHNQYLSLGDVGEPEKLIIRTLGVGVAPTPPTGGE